MNISQEQLQNSQEWEQRLIKGECNLNDALYMCMASGAPISKYMQSHFSKATDDYSRGLHDDLAEAFGIAMTKRTKQTMSSWDLKRKTVVVVDLFAEQGFTKNNPNHYSNTAFHKAALAINKSPSHAYDLYQQGKKDLNLM